MRLIERAEYLDELMAVAGTPDIKVITGVRRAGKSKLLEMFMLRIRKMRPSVNIVHVDFNLPENDHLRTATSLYQYVLARSRGRKRSLVFIDEVQMCDGFERAINGLHATGRYDIYITGSNAFLLSSDLATLFTGRTYAIMVHPFSLREYMKYFRIKDGHAAFERYLAEGGMAGACVYRDITAKYKYLSEVFKTLIVRNIIAKHKIRSPQLLEKITDFMMDNIANLSSARSVADTLNSNHDQINHKTVSTYLQYLSGAYLFYKVRRYDIRGKKYLASNDKYYLCDHGFRFARLGTRNMDYGRMMENIVAVELLRRGFEVYVGVLYKKEIDFVAIRRDAKIYIQVADNISDGKTLSREVSPLLQIRDANQKMLIANTHHGTYTHEGILIVDIADWLCSV